MIRKSVFIFFAGLLFLIELGHAAEPIDAERLVRRAVQYYRGNASFALLDMTIDRPAWERTLTIKGWTRGQKDSLITIIAPPKDEGNGTLKKGREMWIYNPKVNRTIKLPLHDVPGLDGFRFLQQRSGEIRQHH